MPFLIKLFGLQHVTKHSGQNSFSNPSASPWLLTDRSAHFSRQKRATSKNMKSIDCFKVIAIAIFGIIRGIFYLILISSMFGAHRWGLKDIKNVLEINWNTSHLLLYFPYICFCGTFLIIINNALLLIGFIKKHAGLMLFWLIFEKIICWVGTI